MTAAHIDDLPAGLDWQAFQSRCFPERRRHDLKALAAYSAYKRRPRETAARDEVTVTAVETWEDEGGSMAQVDHAVDVCATVNSEGRTGADRVPRGMPRLTHKALSSNGDGGRWGPREPGPHRAYLA